MKEIALFGVHNFVKVSTFSTHDRCETFWRYRCQNCGLIARKYGRGGTVTVSDSFSDTRIQKCERDNFIDKYVDRQIQISCKIHNFEKEIPIYSIHTVVRAASGFVNGERGVWVNIKGKLYQILDDEYVFYPIAPRQRPQIGFKRKKLPIKTGFIRTIKPKFKRTR
jgi:hypothetical protein